MNGVIVRRMVQKSSPLQCLGAALYLAVSSILAVVVVDEPTVAAAAEDRAYQLPRVIRYVSMLAGFQGRTCFGLVVADSNGIPVRVRNLATYDRSLCDGGNPARPYPDLLKLAFEAAEFISRRNSSRPQPDTDVETLPPAELARIVKSPVSITMAQLEANERFIIGVGLNYPNHRAEVASNARTADSSDGLVVFPKLVAPSGPYAPVRPGARIGDTAARPVLLLDHEIELGFVLLEDLDLADPPTTYGAFIATVAFFTANDVSDRRPIILDIESGYTRGKSHPTFLPIGPWMVHGTHLRPRTASEGERSLRLRLGIREIMPCNGCDTPKYQTRIAQSDTTGSMLNGPWRIVQHLSARYRQGSVVCMRDADGRPRFIHDADGIIPAGSIILTGTPGGTAIREPGVFGKVALFVRGGLSVDGARREFVKRSERRIGDSGYLEPGDRVETWIEQLGRQRWTVVKSERREPYGIVADGRCPADAAPRRIRRPD